MLLDKSSHQISSFQSLEATQTSHGNRYRQNIHLELLEASARMANIPPRDLERLP